MIFLKCFLPETLAKLINRRTWSGTLPHLLSLIRHRLSGQGSNILCADVGIANVIPTWFIGAEKIRSALLVQMESGTAVTAVNDCDKCPVKGTLRLAQSISALMQKVILTGNGQIVESKSNQKGY